MGQKMYSLLSVDIPRIFSAKNLSRYLPFVCSRATTTLDVSLSDDEADVLCEREAGDGSTRHFTEDDLKPNDFVLVKFPSKKSLKYYIGEVLRRSETGEFVIKFLRRNETSFIYPDQDDIGEYPFTDIELKLAHPILTGGTARVAQRFKFDVDLSTYVVY